MWRFLEVFFNFEKNTHHHEGCPPRERTKKVLNIVYSVVRVSNMGYKL